MMTAMMTAMSKNSAWETGDADRIDIRDEAEVERWARRLCTCPNDLKAAIALVGPVVRDVKGHLFVALVKDYAARTKR